MSQRRILATGAIATIVVASGATAWAKAATDDSAGEPSRPHSPTSTTKGADGARVTEPLRAEHRELIPHIEALATAGDAVGVAPLEEQRHAVHEAYTFLADKLIPHATAEDKVLYVTVDDLIGKNGTTRATDTMRRDHTEVAHLTERLGALGTKLHDSELTADEQREVRRTLYALNGIVELHFAKEEEVYLPLLDRTLSAEEAHDLFERMEKVNAESGGTAHAH